PVSRRPNAIPKMSPNRRARSQAEGVMFSGRHLVAPPVGRIGPGRNEAAVQDRQLGVDGVGLAGGECALVDVMGVVVQELPQEAVPLLGAQAFSVQLSVLQE